MGGGVHWAEWILPAAGAIHTAHNMGVNIIGQSGAKVVSPGSALAKKEKAQVLAETEREQREADTRQRQALAEEQRIANLPRNVRARAEQSSRALGESGRRESASQYLAG